MMRTSSIRVDLGHLGRATQAPDAVAVIDDILHAGDTELDYGDAKVAFDHLVDPSQSIAAVTGQIDRMVDAARQLAGPSHPPPM